MAWSAVFKTWKTEFIFAKKNRQINSDFKQILVPTTLQFLGSNTTHTLKSIVEVW